MTSPNESKTEHAESESSPVLTLIRKLQAHEISGKDLTVSERQECAEYLFMVGYSVSEIAQVLSLSDRTIKRYHQTMRSNHAMTKDPRLTEEWAGRLMMEIENCIHRIHRAVRDANTPVQVRVDAERTVVWMLCELTQRLQSMGYIDNQATAIKAEVTHHLGSLPSEVQIMAELKRLQQINPGDPSLNAASQAIAHLTDSTTTPSNEKETNDEEQ